MWSNPSFFQSNYVENVPPERFQDKDACEGNKGKRSCSLPLKNAVAFFYPFLRAPKGWRREFRRLRTATMGYSPQCGEMSRRDKRDGLVELAPGPHQHF
jgi:hypothetical protein